MKIIRKDINIITRLLTILMIAITGYLFVVSLFSTVYVSEFENIYYIEDHALINIAAIICFTGCVFLLKDKLCKLIEGRELKIVLINSAILFVILMYFVMSTRLYPLYDQAKIITTVKQLNAYDYSSFLPGGYEDRYDVQWGITLYFYFISRLFGNISIGAIQTLNAVCIVTINLLIYRITSFAFSKKAGVTIHFATCLYMPQWFYSSFVYGTLPSFMFALLSIYFIALMRNQIKILEETPEVYSIWGRDFIITPKARRALSAVMFIILAAVSMSISIMLKTNSLIILIAMVLVLGYYLLRDAKPVYAIAGVTLILVYVASSNALTKGIEDMTRMTPQGIPRTGHVAMALMENSDKGPGWYNGYNAEVYEKNDFNTLRADAEARKEIDSAIAAFKSNPANLISFISRKTVSQWNEPTFESLYILYRRESIPETPGWFKSLSVPTSSMNKMMRELFNIMHVIILFGALCYFVLEYKNITLDHLVFAIIVIGGFLFHTIWEAKSQYILIYFMLLIAYTVKGYNTLVVDIKSHTKSKDSKSLPVFAVILLCICIFTAFVPKDSIPGKLLKPSWKTEEYLSVTSEEYNDIKPAGRLDKDYIDGLKVERSYKLAGRYYIQNADDNNMYLRPENQVKPEGNSDENEQNAILKFCYAAEPSIADSVILFEVEPEKYIIRFQNNQKVMDVENGIIQPGSKLHMWEFNGDRGQCFSLVRNEDGTCKIVCGDYAVKVADDDGIELTEKEDTDVLRVNLIKVE